MSLTDNVPIPRKTMVLFFMIDTSWSMRGAKIDAVNSTIKEVIPELENLSDANADAQIKIATLAFSTGARWLTPRGPIAVENYVWKDLTAQGLTDFGDACVELNQKLSTSVTGFMREATGSFAPAIFLLSDGRPGSYKKKLGELRKNDWFRKAIKVAVAIGNDADCSILAEFTGTGETVVTVHNVAMLKKMIKFVSVRASEVASKNANVGSPEGGDSKQAAFIDELNNFKVEAAASADAGEDDEW
ncbi:MAG: VWA domain-containing protein [Kiritimatiellaeota bacterium]|nr:VWA domain-containing protein [Kiritimatiellota bacterium]